MENLASYCLTEPGAGSDAAALRMRAVKDGGAYGVECDLTVLQLDILFCHLGDLEMISQ